MRVLLITVGSHGDIHPYIALARALMARGAEVLLTTNPFFQGLIEHAGVPFEPLGEYLDVRDTMQEDNIHRPYLAVGHLLRHWIMPYARPIHDRATDLIRAMKPDVALVHPIALGAHWACEAAGVPWVSINLSPVSWMNGLDAFVAGPHAPRWPNPPRWFTRTNAYLAPIMMRALCDRTLNRTRRELGMPGYRDHFMQAMRGGTLNIGLWAPALRDVLPGDTPGTMVLGFPWFDVHEPSRDDERLDRFLSEGPPPIMFARGTAFVHRPGEFFTVAMRVCQELNRRGVLLVGRAGEPPRDLPSSILAVGYAPFSTLMPRAACTVHHGGAGSTAQGLRSGRPTVICPTAFDQFDFAARCERLGVSKTVRSHRLSAPRLIKAIGTVLDDPACADRAAAIAPSMSVDGAAAAAVAVQRFASDKRIDRAIEAERDS